VTSDTGFVLWKDKEEDLIRGGASFEVGFKSSEDAFRAGRLMEYHYLIDENGTRYSLKAVRMHRSIGHSEEDDDNESLEKMVQPEDTAEKDILTGDDGQVIGWRVRDTKLHKTASPEPRIRRGKRKIPDGPEVRRK
jgi:hypothetical protein